jgi:hypothetical protein
MGDAQSHFVHARLQLERENRSLVVSLSSKSSKKNRVDDEAAAFQPKRLAVDKSPFDFVSFKLFAVADS